jgi:glycosyltransferase involved in cell wall biosynthesis
MISPKQFNLIGPASSYGGLGVITREYARTLIAAHLNVSIFDIDIGAGRSGLDLSLQSCFVPNLDQLPEGVNIWILGGPVVNDFARILCNSEKLKKSFNVAFVWWELPDVPGLWTIGIRAFDAVIAASEFVREAWANHLSGVPVLLAPSPLSMPGEVLPARERFGLPTGSLLIYTGFEPGSDPVRKNPFAAVHAFRRAFPVADDADVRLVVKVNNPSVAGKLHAGMARLYELIQGDDRVVLLNERLGYKDLLSLYASCDIVMSLHRAEGLGLIPLEAMRLGKAIVATGWSGNMTYMNHCNAALVRYDLVPTDETATHYSPSAVGIGSHWAEPDIDHAAAWLRVLAKDESLRLGYGRQAALDSVAYDQRARAASFVDELAALHLHRGLVPAKDHREILANVQVAVRRDQLRRMTPVQRQITRAKHVLATQLDRHVMWRFRAPK